MACRPDLRRPSLHSPCTSPPLLVRAAYCGGRAWLRLAARQLAAAARRRAIRAAVRPLQRQRQQQQARARICARRRGVPCRCALGGCARGGWAAGGGGSAALLTRTVALAACTTVQPLVYTGLFCALVVYAACKQHPAGSGPSKRRARDAAPPPARRCWGWAAARAPVVPAPRPRICLICEVPSRPAPLLSGCLHSRQLYGAAHGALA